MNIIVLLSRAIDSEQQIKLESGEIDYSDVSFIINPLDEIALEAAIRLKEKYGGNVAAVCAGDEYAEKQLRLALAMGADKGIHLLMNDLKAEAWQIAQAIADFIKTMPFDLIISGSFAIDGGSGQVGPRVAARLNVPYLTNIASIEIEKNQALIRKKAGDAIEAYRGVLPLLITVPQGFNSPRLPNVASIMKAKRKPLEKIQPQLDHEPSTLAIQYELPIKNRKNQIFMGDNQTQIMKLAGILKKLL
ncbi:electron transfer flavoprotein subunit beta/FixA family protein [Niallia sp. NCCP-28]|uniref:electron transfer flavoprotein subunit beta/FixA family protein n=1 Tax=Niallia sp. NCCP-28 TaxID=2934712 RepID=UPI002082D380|nr:electron transfer flavoprotein subunit beta/FixA family protein [Niallia sp. NCCP-28]GKU81512.1 electron transfer flavoprotein subunit beta [Niallia sp. NCCP-28]